MQLSHNPLEDAVFKYKFIAEQSIYQQMFTMALSIKTKPIPPRQLT